MTAGRVTGWWCEHAWVAPGEVRDRVLIVVDDGKITSIQADVEPAADMQRLRGLVIPGLANAHSHAFHRALRGRTNSGRGDFWSWRTQMYRSAERLDPQTYLALAAATFAEMALAGITCVGEFHYLHHGPGGVRYGDPNVMSHVLIQAAQDVGIRLTLLDACYLHGGFGEPLQGAQLRFGDGDAEQWATRVEQLLPADAVRVGAAIHSVRGLSPDEMRVVAGFAAKRGMPLHMHVSEQVAENDGCAAMYGRTPVELLSEVGALGPASVAIHATHVSGTDEALLADAATGVCLCPTTERDLADGVGPAPSLAARGVSLSLGSDSHAVIDLFEEARAVELDQRLISGRRGSLGAPALLDAATVDGHRALGWPDAGRLAIGMRADLVAVSLDSVRTAGCGVSADAVVFAAGAADVTDVVVDGCQIVRDRRHVRMDDVARALRDAIAVLQE
jgi:formiminoglutamate deiminase